MYPKIIALALVALFITPSLTLAQVPTQISEEGTPPGPSLPPTPETIGTVSCFDYYDFGSVFPAISTPVQSAVTGSAMTFTVDMENSNVYPVVDGTLYVKIFRSQPDEEYTYTQGNHVVDQFKVAEDVNIDANSTNSLNFDWVVPLYAGPGEYYAATYFATNDRYNLSGLTFTDDIIGGSVPFTLSSETSLIYFDKNNVILNGEDYRFIGPPLTMDKTAPVTVSFPVVNDTDTEQEVIIEWTTNEWDSLQEDEVRNIAIEAVSVPANSSVTASYEVPEFGAPVYLVEPRLKVRNEVVSAMNVRFVRDDTDVSRINFPSIISYPLKAGVENTLFSCLHNAGQAHQVPGGELTLTLYDTYNNQLHSYQYTGIITGAMMGVKDTFVPDTDITDFTLHAVLKVDGQVLEDTRIDYRCADINPDLCVTEVAASTDTDAGSDTSSDSLVIVITLISLVVLLTAAGLHIQSRKNGDDDEALEEEDDEDRGITNDPNQSV